MNTTRIYAVIKDPISRARVSGVLSSIGLTRIAVHASAPKLPYSESWSDPHDRYAVAYGESSFFGCSFLMIDANPADASAVLSSIPCYSMDELAMIADDSADEERRLRAIYKLGIASYYRSRPVLDVFRKILTTESNYILRHAVLCALTQHVLPEDQELLDLAIHDSNEEVRSLAEELRSM